MKRICLFLLILFAGCQKENDPNITRDDYCGDYCGITSSNNISISIKKSDNNSKYLFAGTYTGDSTTVTISSVNEKSVLSIKFPENRVPGGWEKISVHDDVCSFAISTDSAYDISSGERYKLSGSVRKLGNNLHFSFTAYYQGYSPIYFYKFTVSKEE
jgi:hypothetical protein